MSFPADLLNARTAAGLTQRAAAQKLTEKGVDVSERSITGYESGKHTPGPAKRKALLDGLAILREGRATGGDTGTPPDVRQPRVHILGRVRVPYYGPVGAGPGRVPPAAVGHIDVPEAEYAADFGGAPRAAGGQLVAVGGVGYFTVEGDSAAPVFFDRERVPCEVLSEPTEVFANDTIYVFRWEGDQMLKRLRRLPGGTVEARSLNPGIEPFRFQPGIDSHDFAVLAVVRVSPKQQLYGALVGRFLRTEL